jgi:hypothetical protein
VPASGSARTASFAAPVLDSFASLAADELAVVDPDGIGAGEAKEADEAGAASAVGAGAGRSEAPAGTGGGAGADTRSVRGLVALLSRPNEGAGRLDAGSGAAGGDADFDAGERLEALRECARRVFYLLTMRRANGALSVPEAERRLVWLINSLYMPAMPASASVLHMPSLTVVTPHYNEAVLYGKDDFLALPNRHGVSPFLYLKSTHGREFLNLLERLGARDETEAWGVRTDALGAAVSGEVELRLWASCRGQTLA